MILIWLCDLFADALERAEARGRARGYWRKAIELEEAADHQRRVAGILRGLREEARP